MRSAVAATLLGLMAVMLPWSYALGSTPSGGLMPSASAADEPVIPATARLITGTQVHPGTAVAFSIRVRNEEAQGATRAIDEVIVSLPVDSAGITNNAAPLAPPDGWTATRQTSRFKHRIIFKTTGSGIGPKRSTVFDLSAAVARPLDADRIGTFVVEIDSVAKGTMLGRAAPQGLGALDSAVRALEIVAAPRPIAPAGVTDGTATAGQAITSVFSVRNHAQQPLAVTATLGSDDASDTIEPAAAKSIGGAGGQAQFVFPITLGEGAGTDRIPRFTAAATATGASAPTVTNTLVVQAPAQLTALALDPSRVRSDVAVSFTTFVTKKGTPAVQVSAGELSIGGSSASLATGASLPGGPADHTFTFDPLQVDLDPGEHPATVAFSGTDDNGHPVTSSSVLTVVVDSQPPQVLVDADLPAGHDAIKDGDPIRVTGSIDAGAGDAIGAGTLEVSLEPDVGPAIAVPVTVTRTSPSQHSFTGTVSPVFDPTATKLVALATADDLAGNRGRASSTERIVDNIAPTLTDPGEVLGPREIRIEFTDTRPTSLDGGCDPNAYSIGGGLAVSHVRIPGSAASCLSGFGGAVNTGARILVLANDIPVDDTPVVSYTRRSGADPLADGAGNEAASQTIQTINMIPPDAPTIVQVTRNSGTEEAHLDADSGYFTRFGGDDLRVTFDGARAGYSIQVLDGDGTVLAEHPLVDSDPDGPAGEPFRATVNVPIGSTDGAHARALRLVSSHGVLGHTTSFDVVLDTVSPAIAATSLNNNEVHVSFDDVIAGGTNLASDWLVFEHTDGGRQYYSAETVDVIDGSTRVIRFPSQGDGFFGGVTYILSTSNSLRYEDRAGNPMSDYEP